MLYALLVTLYVIVSIFLILVVLLQTGKRADLAGAFGGGGSQTALGTRGAANMLTRATTVAAVAFMAIALTLSIMTSRGTDGGGSVLDEVPAPAGAPPLSETTGDNPLGTDPLGSGGDDPAATDDPANDGSQTDSSGALPESEPE